MEQSMTLKSIAIYSLTKNLDVISHRRNDQGYRQLDDNIIIPFELCDTFIEKYQRFHGQLDEDNVIGLFCDTKKTPLRSVRLRNSALSDEGLEIIMRHKLKDLSLWHCEGVSERLFEFVRKYGENLQSLEIGDNAFTEHKVESEEPTELHLTSPHLKRLVLNNLIINQDSKFTHLPSLMHLNLSSCFLENFSFMNLRSLPHLQNLILFNSCPQESQLDEICQLSNLRVLDISIKRYRNDTETVYNLQNQTLKKIIEKLPKLTHFDISGINLVGNEFHNTLEALTTRKEKPFEYLGLYHTTSLRLKRKDIPAIEISGNANEHEIQIAGRYNLSKAEVLLKVFEDLSDLVSSGECRNVETSLTIVLEAMDRHLKVENLQVDGSAILYDIFEKYGEKKCGISLRNHVIRTLLHGVQMHFDNESMVHNFLILLRKFHLFHDVILEHNDLLNVLLEIISKPELNDSFQTEGLLVMSSLSEQDQWRDKLLAKKDVVKTLLDVINDRLSCSICDDSVKYAWSLLLTLTETSLACCIKFFKNNGIKCIVRCLNNFTNDADLLAIILSSLVNMAQGKWYRAQLMSTDFIECILALANSDSHELEVCACAAGILAYIASDGTEDWKIDTPTRNDVLVQLVEVIENCNVGGVRQIIYSSLKPLVDLIQCYETPECQLWAVWNLASLTCSNPYKYCELIEKENVIPLLVQVLEDSNSNEKIKQIIQEVILICMCLRSG